MEIEELIELLREISNKLDRNNETLQRLYDETRRSNIALLNFGEENPKIARTSLSQIDIEAVYTGSNLFVAYSRQELLEFLQKAADKRRGSFVYSKKVASPEDLPGRISSCHDGDIILFDLDEICDFRESIAILVDAIEENRSYFYMRNSRSLCLDLPEVHIQFYSATELYLPKELESSLKTIFING